MTAVILALLTIGGVVSVVLTLLIYAACVLAGRDDERAGRK